MHQIENEGKVQSKRHFELQFDRGEEVESEEDEEAEVEVEIDEGALPGRDEELPIECFEVERFEND